MNLVSYEHLNVEVSLEEAREAILVTQVWKSTRLRIIVEFLVHSCEMLADPPCSGELFSGAVYFRLNCSFTQEGRYQFVENDRPITLPPRLATYLSKDWNTRLKLTVSILKPMLGLIRALLTMSFPYMKS